MKLRPQRNHIHQMVDIMDPWLGNPTFRVWGGCGRVALIVLSAPKEFISMYLH